MAAGATVNNSAINSHDESAFPTPSSIFRQRLPANCIQRSAPGGSANSTSGGLRNAYYDSISGTSFHPATDPPCREKCLIGDFLLSNDGVRRYKLHSLAATCGPAYRAYFIYRVGLGRPTDVRSLLIALALYSLAGSAQAVEDPAWQQPVAELDRMVGFWEVTTFARDSDGEWQAGHITLSSIGQEPGSSDLREDALIVDPLNRFELVSYWSWDQHHDTYRVAVMDKRLGVTDVYEGADTEDGLILTKGGGGQVFTARDDPERPVRLRQEFLGSELYTLYVEENVGDNWQDFLRIEYRKKPANAAAAAAILMQSRHLLTGGNML